MNDKLKFYQDKKSFRILNEVIEACKKKPMYARELMEEVNCGSTTIYLTLEKLTKCANPFLASFVKTGKKNRKSNYYVSIRDNYPIEEYIPISVRHQKVAIANGTYKNKKLVEKPVKPEVVVETKDSHIRVIAERHPTKVIRSSSFRGIGSSMGMFNVA